MNLKFEIEMTWVLPFTELYPFVVDTPLSVYCAKLQYCVPSYHLSFLNMFGPLNNTQYCSLHVVYCMPMSCSGSPSGKSDKSRFSE